MGISSELRRMETGNVQAAYRGAALQGAPYPSPRSVQTLGFIETGLSGSGAAQRGCRIPTDLRGAAVAGSVWCWAEPINPEPGRTWIGWFDSGLNWVFSCRRIQKAEEPQVT